VSAIVRAADARNFVGRRTTVEFTVAHAGYDNAPVEAHLLFLNSTVNFRTDPNGFTAVLRREVADRSFGQGKWGELKGRFADKTVQVTGVVRLYDDRPQIVLEGAEQITIIVPVEGS
jgi:hypothetical protein